jgi:hypothetical protein
MASKSHAKPAQYGGWRERSDSPLKHPPMTAADVAELQNNLAVSYKCDVSDIDTVFQKITDEDDVDRDECLWLKYIMKCVVDGRQSGREVFCIKVPIPAKVRQQADELRRQQASSAPARHKPLRTLSAPQQQVAETPADTDPIPVTARTPARQTMRTVRRPTGRK